MTSTDLRKHKSSMPMHRRPPLLSRLPVVSLAVAMLAASSGCALDDGSLDEDLAEDGGDEASTSTTEQALSPLASNILGGLVTAALSPGIKAGVSVLFPSLAAATAAGATREVAAQVGVQINQGFIDYILADVASLFTSANQYPAPCTPSGTTNCTNGILISRQSTVDGILLKANSAVEFLNASQYRSARIPASSTLAAAALAQSNFVMERHILTKLQATPAAQRQGHHAYLSNYSTADLASGSTSLGAFCNTSATGSSILSEVIWDVSNQARSGWSIRLVCFGVGGSCFYKNWVIVRPDGTSQRFAEADRTLAYSELDRQRTAYVNAKLEDLLVYSSFKKVQQTLYLRGRCEPQLSTENFSCRAPGDLLRRGSAALVFQTDGNLVMYNGSTPTWASNTGGLGATKVCIDGGTNVVLRRANNTAVWQLNVPGTKMLTLGTVRADKSGPYSVRFRDAAGVELRSL
jgi:hypothetical protein